MHYVYILHSVGSNRYYVGSTSDYLKRLDQHNAGLTRSTKAYKPYALVHLENYTEKSEALKREKQIKRYKGGNEFKKLVNS